MTEQPDFDDDDLRIADGVWDGKATPLKPIKSDKTGRLNFTAAAFGRFVRGTIKHLGERFGHTYKPPQ